jgi:hypothetical protein
MRKESIKKCYDLRDGNGKVAPVMLFPTINNM